MEKPNLYDELSRRLYGFSREIIKRTLVMHCYRADNLDPWLVHLILTEMRAVKFEVLGASTSDCCSASPTQS